MAKGKENSISLKAIGKTIQAKRKERNINISEIDESCGVKYSTVSSIENGRDIMVSKLLKICYALDVHPKDLLDIEMDTILPGEPVEITDKPKSTARIIDLIEEGYFKDWRSTNDVVKTLNKDYPVQVKSKSISVILERRYESGVLIKQYNDKGLKQFMKA